MKEVNSTERNMLFISHAWEDFEFTKWLALQLAKEGYGVWCDLTKLLGGENWPKEVNNSLQFRTTRFLFVLSRSSNIKPDPLGELETARNIMKREEINNFIVPLKIDDISRDEIDYRLQEIQNISFESNWAAGLTNLLKLLKKEKTPKHPSFTLSAVNTWWKKYGTDSCKIINDTEELFSNRFEILHYPTNIYAHFVDEEPKLRGYIKYPVIPHNKYILSFADSEHLQTITGIKSIIRYSHQIQIKDILSGCDNLIENSQTGYYYLARLLNQAFRKTLQNIGLEEFSLARDSCYFFHDKLLETGRIKYTDTGKLDSRIKLWGKFKGEKWYLGIRVNVQKEPILHFAIYPHVLTRGKSGLHAAPKAAYKSWRNHKWRDRINAAVVHFAEDGPSIALKVGTNEDVSVSRNPIPYISPISYEEPNEQIKSAEASE